MGLDESDLIRRAALGEAEAFDRLVEAHTPRLYRMLRRLTSDGAEAEALIQEAWLRAWKGRARCSADRPFFPWIATIAVRLARDDWRKRRPLDFADLGESWEESTGDGDSIERRIESHQARERLAALVRELRPEWQAVIALRYDGHLGYGDIAQALGIPVNTVRTHLRRARLELRRRLEEEHD